MVPAKVAFGKVEILIGFAKLLTSYFSLSGRQHKEDHTPHSTRKTHLIVTKLMVIDNHPVDHDQ